jgi:glutaredoxin 3
MSQSAPKFGPELMLYQFESCPYCRKVRHFMTEHNLDLPRKDTREDPAAREELIRLGGKSQVPALAIDGAILYESDAIIDWLRAHVIAPAQPGR